MDNETTNRLILTANQDIPNIINRKTATLTTTALAPDVFVPTDIYATGTASYTTNLKSSGNNDWEVVMVDNATNLTYFLPCAWYGDVVDTDGIVGHTYIDNSGGYLRINVLVQKLGAAIGATFTLYYVVYSTKITDDITL